MRQLKWFSLLILTVFVFACPKPPVTPPPVPAERGEEVFQRAEQLYRSGALEAALKAYQTYLSNYPQQLFAATALNRQGEIYLSLGNTEKAKIAYERLIKEYPNSPLVKSARLGLVRVLFRDGNFEQAIQFALTLDISQLSKSQAFDYLNLLGSSYDGAGDFRRAVFYFSLALGLASDPEKDTVREKLKKTVEKIDPDTLQRLLAEISHRETRGYLSYQEIANLVKKEAYQAALDRLTDFMETYPDHPLTSQAMELKSELSAKLKPPAVLIPEHRRYTVGCMLPLSGPYEIYGQRALQGIEIALNEFNSKNMNPSMSILVKDTGSDPDRAIRAVEDLNHDQVAAVIGPITTAVPAAFAAQERGLPIMTLTQKEDITIIGDYVFRNFITPRMQVNTIVKFVIRQLGLERFAILYPDEHYGTTFMNLFWDEVIAHDGKVVGVESYDPKSTDFADPIKKLVGLYYAIPEDLKPKPLFSPDEDAELDSADEPEDDEPKPIVDFDAIFLPDAPNKAGLIIPQLVFYDIEDVYLLGTNLWHSEKLITMAGQYAQGAIVADGFFAKSKSERVKAFVKRFQETYGKPPEFIEAIAYDNAMMLFDILSRPEIDSRERLKNELLSISTYPGITGATAFDENGDAVKRLSLIQLKKDRFVELENEPL